MLRAAIPFTALYPAASRRLGHGHAMLWELIATLPGQLTMVVRSARESPALRSCDEALWRARGPAPPLDPIYTLGCERHGGARPRGEDRVAAGGRVTPRPFESPAQPSVRPIRLR
jgi:hypothetical protein